MSERARFIAAVLLQVGLLLLISITRLDTLDHGDRVTLETAPVDPYDLLSGYYVTLTYRVEREAAEMVAGSDGPVWLHLAPDTPGWRLVRVTDGSVDAAPGQVRVEAERVDGGRVRITSAGRMFIAEDLRGEIERALRGALAPPLVDLRVGADGEALVRRLRVDDRVFGAAAP